MLSIILVSIPKYSLLLFIIKWYANKIKYIPNFIWLICHYGIPLLAELSLLGNHLTHMSLGFSIYKMGIIILPYRSVVLGEIIYEKSKFINSFHSLSTDWVPKREASLKTGWCQRHKADTRIYVKDRREDRQAPSPREFTVQGLPLNLKEL